MLSGFKHQGVENQTGFTENTKREFRWGLIVVWSLVVGPVLGLGSSDQSILAATMSQVPQNDACEWDLVDKGQQGRYLTASAMDTDDEVFYVFGGLDRTGKVQDDLLGLDLSGAQISDAKIIAAKRLVGGRFAAAGAYRGGPDGAVPEDQRGVYIIGGGADAEDADDEASLVYFNVDDGASRTILPHGGFSPRRFAAAAYDVSNDHIWVVGGTEDCPLSEMPCRASNLQVHFLSFETDGSAAWNRGPTAGLPSGLYGHTMVYDHAGTRLIVFGGTRDGQRAENDAYTLDLGGGGSAWQKLNTAGDVPSGMAFHAMALDSDLRRLVVSGGVTRNPFGSEAVQRQTAALDLSASPPQWIELISRDAERVAYSMAYSAKQDAVLRFGGRSKFRAGNDQTVNSDWESLDCVVDVITPTLAPTPTGTSSTVPPGPSPSNTPVPTIIPIGSLCDGLQNKVPNAVINRAVVDQNRIAGWGIPCNPSLPISVWNPVRGWLGLRNPNLPWHPLFNSLEWKCGCR